MERRGTPYKVAEGLGFDFGGVGGLLGLGCDEGQDASEEEGAQLRKLGLLAKLELGVRPD